MKGLRIYIEGGGDVRSQKQTLRLGFQAFLKPLRDLARARGLRWDLILCGGRSATFDDYQIALRQHADSVNLLLVDAEAPVSRPPWEHLRGRDNWTRPDSASDDQCHLMVQLVEAWLIADPDGLANYYGPDFNGNALPVNPNVEAVAKADIESGLQRATAHTQKGPYRKIRHCADLLAKLPVGKVRARARHCERLFATVETMIAQA